MIRKMKVKLPFSEVTTSVCDICGDVIGLMDASHLKSEEGLEKPDVVVGDIVTISEVNPHCPSNISSIVRNPHTVKRLFYAGRHTKLMLRGSSGSQPALHELCIELQKDFPNGGHAWFNTTYMEFRFLRDGSSEALQEAGVLRKPKPIGLISRIFLSK